jgi:hypothetical protein
MTPSRQMWAMLQLVQFAAVWFCIPPVFAQGVITTIAGTDWLFPGNGLPALNAPLSGAQ